MILFGAAFAAIGVFAGVNEASEALREGDPSKLWTSVLVGSVFVAFGGGLVALAIDARKAAEKRAGAENLHPEEPWMLREEWAQRRVPSQTGASAVVLWLFGLVWSAISAPLAWKLPEEIARQGNPLGWLFAMFPLIGLGILVWAIRQSLRWRKFGSSALELKTLPGVIGGRVEATLQLSTHLEAPSGMQLALECIHKRSTGSGKNRSTHERILWQIEHTLPRAAFGQGLTGTAVPVEFSVPYGCQATRGTGSDDEVLWRVSARAEVSGVDYYTRFEVPVFETEESSEDVTGNDTIPELVMTSLGSAEALPGSKVRVEPWGAGGRQFWFGPARNPIAASVTTLATLGLATLTRSLNDQGAPWAVVLGCGFVAALSGLGAIVHWLGATRVRVETGKIQVTRGPLGVGRTRSWRSADLSRIAVRRGSQYGNNLYWDLKLEIDRPGRTRSDGSPWPTAYAAGSRLPSENEARALANAMADTLGLEA
jgi:hypothetical protein